VTDDYVLQAQLVDLATDGGFISTLVVSWKVGEMNCVLTPA
jgi:hypothetical protein